MKLIIHLHPVVESEIFSVQLSGQKTCYVSNMTYDLQDELIT